MTNPLAALNEQRQAKGLDPVTADDIARIRNRKAFEAAATACRHILTRLQLIDDAPTSTIRTEGRLTHGTGSQGLRTRDSHALAVKGGQFSTSQIPEGVRLGGDLTQPNGHAPSKQFSLWAHYSYRMARAQAQEDAPTLLKLAACATRDYEIHIRRRPAFHENHEAAVTELLRDCTGVAAAEASWWLGAPEKWVRRQRVINGRDSEFGEATRMDARFEMVRKLAGEGLTQRVIADELGISQARVSQILAGK